MTATSTSGDPASERASESRSQSTRRPQVLGLYGLRGVGAMCVLLYHVVDSTRDGLAVRGAVMVMQPVAHALTVFFVLSGFLIFLPFVTAFLRDGSRPHTGRYFLGRLLRIYPVYVVIFLVVNFVMGAANVVNVRVADGDPLGTITDPLTLLANLLLVQSLIPETLSTGILPSWSLTTELGFYLVVPLLALVMMRVARRWRTPLLVAAAAPALLMVLIGTVVRVITTPVLAGAGGERFADLYWGPNWFAVLIHSTPAQADLFGYGMLAAVAFGAMSAGMLRAPSPRVAAVLYAAVGVLLFLGLVLAYGDLTWGLTLCIAWASALLILLLSAASRFGTAAAGNPVIWLLEWAPVRGFGVISLSAYLWHMPVLHWLAMQGMIVDSYPTLLNTLGLTLVITITLSIATYYLVERPAAALAHRHRRSSAARTNGTVGG